MDTNVVVLEAHRPVAPLELVRRIIAAGYDVADIDCYEDDLTLIDRLQLAQDRAAA